MRQCTGRWMSVLLLLAVLAAGCSPRYTVYEVSNADFLLEEDALVSSDTTLVVAYDFWSDSGEPFVSILNPGRDTAYLNLGRSSVETETFGRVALLDVLGGGPNSRRRDVFAAYPELTLSGPEREPELVLAPETWISFYSVPIARATAFDWHPRDRSRETLTVNYAWHRAGISQSSRHRFQSSPVEHLRRAAYRRSGTTLAQPNRYFIDRGPARRQQTIQLALDIGSTVIIAL